MKLKIHDANGSPNGEMDVPFTLIENAKGTQAVHDSVVAFRAGQRAGTACTKTAGEVAGTNKKPWRQKGTGRARAGSFQSPLWRGGGVVFGPRPRDFSKKVNRKSQQLAFHKAFSERLMMGDVVILEDIKLASAKTKDFVKMMDALNLEGTALIVTGDLNAALLQASRNVPLVEVTTGSNVNAYQVLKYDKLIVTKSALESLGKRIN